MFNVLKLSMVISEVVDYTLNGNHTLQPPSPVNGGGLGGGVGSDEHCLPVFQLCEDDIAEDNETFSISLSSPDPPVSLLHNNFTVTIIDDDSKKSNILQNEKNLWSYYLAKITLKTALKFNF